MLECRKPATPSALGSVTYEPPPAPFAVRIRFCAASSPQRLAERRAADAELPREHLLVRQPRAGLQRALDDAAPELGGDLLVLLRGYAGTSAAISARYSSTRVGRTSPPRSAGARRAGSTRGRLAPGRRRSPPGRASGSRTRRRRRSSPARSPDVMQPVTITVSRAGGREQRRERRAVEERRPLLDEQDVGVVPTRASTCAQRDSSVTSREARAASPARGRCRPRRRATRRRSGRPARPPRAPRRTRAPSPRPPARRAARRPAGTPGP